ncbi:MAG: DUF1501 domain-containing protein [Alphaproteobacteria bacterium]|nr:DUF1501 domain-containing protein [Alphaproteobacteria bacterium]MCW5744241.1 DUF1501 domain-containing protein [Alphaproteobacteria bacterium]
MLRRDLLAGLSGFAVALGSGAAWAQNRPGVAPAPASPTGARFDRILVLVELRGGNDGLNTLVPYADPAYQRARGALAVPRERVLQLDERVGLHQTLAPMMEAWKAGDLAILQGVGYPYPNRSHFRSIEIWDTASAASQTITEGWMAQAFAGVKRPAGRRVDSVVVDTNALFATGGDLQTIVMQDAENFINQARAMRETGTRPQVTNPALEHILKVRAEIHAASLGLAEHMKNAPAPAAAYGDGPLAQQLELATRILLARVPVLAVKVALGGFDTHAGQATVHERLLGQLGRGLATLRRNLIAANRWNDVMLMTYTEFGRRVKPNASSGTDHGTASPQFVMGGAVKGGLHGAYPSLIDLQDGDLKHTIDFRNVFGTVAKKWWGLNRDFGMRQPQTLSFTS